MKKIICLLFSIIVMIGINTTSEAKSRNAVEGTDYAVTYQYFNVYEGKYGGVNYQAIIEITNIGTKNLYLGTATFDIYDLNGNIVASENYISSDPSVIAPGEKGYYFNNGGTFDNPMGQYTLPPTISVEYTNLESKKFPVNNTSIKKSKYGGIDILGTVTNDTDKDEGLLWIAFVVFDSEDRPIGVYGTNILDFNAGITVGFEGHGMMLPYYVTLDNVARYEVIAAPTQYQF